VDFTLPAVSGVGRDLSNAEFRGLIDRYNPKSFFSPELMVNYFTYHDGSGTHFLLHDNAESLRRKLSAVSDAGIRYALLFYPRVADIFGDIGV
jgi:spore germination protein YaaH